MSSGGGLSNSSTDGDLQIISAPERPKHALPPLPLASSSPFTASNAIVEYKKPGPKEIEDEDLEVKLRRILDHIPVRVSNTSGSSAGSGSGDFHQYRQMRRKEQDRLTRMDVDYQKRKGVTEFNMRREERVQAAEERTAKKRLKRQKKKLKKKEKKVKLNSDGGEPQKDESDDEDESDDGDKVK
ncbi:Protein of unknown function DUF1168 [Macleaya cordata]|uniref:PRKR-interacting protein 1 n=1 Tax=Macleaya cordata TaxID=56857 RepID=A0A200PV20_MACCD|nr:Protein of unknown function DUF1168 [Macleaya cordata]